MKRPFNLSTEDIFAAVVGGLFVLVVYWGTGSFNGYLRAIILGMGVISVAHWIIAGDKCPACKKPHALRKTKTKIYFWRGYSETDKMCKYCGSTRRERDYSSSS